MMKNASSKVHVLGNHDMYRYIYIYDWIYVLIDDVFETYYVKPPLVQYKTQTHYTI